MCTNTRNILGYNSQIILKTSCFDMKCQGMNKNSTVGLARAYSELFNGGMGIKIFLILKSTFVMPLLGWVIVILEGYFIGGLIPCCFDHLKRSNKS